jgi:hypothetical protein
MVLFLFVVLRLVLQVVLDMLLYQLQEFLDMCQIKLLVRRL